MAEQSMASSTNEKLEIISWKEFTEGIAPMWNTKPKDIPIFNNPGNIIQFPQEEWGTKIICFPCAYYVGDEVVGYISIYNISNTMIRPRGIYIKEEHRGQGLGHRMQKAAWDLFPETFHRAFIWSRSNNVARFCKHSQMSLVPEGKMWSEYSKDDLFLLYHDRGPKPDLAEQCLNHSFIRENEYNYSYGGKNNLDVSWSRDEWDKYFFHHAGNYEDLKLDLMF